MRAKAKNKVTTKMCKRCGREFEYSELDAGEWEDYCYKCEKILEKEKVG